MKLKLYNVKPEYAEYLKKYDSCVPKVSEGKEKRPFTGIVLNINSVNYYAPFFSPKEKHLTMKDNIDFVKINKGKWGVININNMIPVPMKCLKYADLDIHNTTDIEEIKYKKMLIKQSLWCNQTLNQQSIINKSKKLYDTIVNEQRPTRLSKRCCDFKLLEQKCKIYQTAMELNNKELPSSTIERLLKDFSADDIKEIIATSELAPHHKTMLHTELIKSLDIDVPTKNICR